MNILDELAEHARYRVAELKKNESLDYVKSKALSLPKGMFEFEKAINKKNDLAFICECKKASPSKGIIAEDFPYLKIAKEYEDAGADCISVLTEPKWFMGSDDYLYDISENVSIPCLRKDFTVDEYMIYQAKCLGAKAILLICSILDKNRLLEYIDICDSLGISALVEAHDDREIEMALDCKARIIGVNNRNLKDFSVDTNNSMKLRKLIPDDVIYVSESGIKDANDISLLRMTGVNAVLVGETLMKAKDKTIKLNELKGVTGLNLNGLN